MIMDLELPNPLIWIPLLKIGASNVLEELELVYLVNLSPTGSLYKVKMIVILVNYQVIYNK